MYQRFTPQEAFQWKKTGVSVIKLKVKLTKRTLTTLELRKLIKRKTPTNDVKHFIKHIKSKYHRNRMLHSIMTQKLRNAVYMEHKIRRQFERCHQYMRRRWRHHTFLTSQFNIIMQQQIVFTWNTDKARVQSKIDNLAHSWHSNPNKPPDILEDVLISDKFLEERFGQEEKLPLPVYGGVQVNEAEAACLELGPKYCIAPAVTMEQVQVATEKVMTQVRWELESRARRDGEDWSEEWQLEQTKAHQVFNEEDSLIDLSVKRVTDLKSNRRTIIPEPREESINNIPVEVALANMKTKIETFAHEGMKKNCDKNGFPIKTNLSSIETEGLKQLRKRVEVNDIYITKSDKTGTFVANNRENYVERMNPHLENCTEITWEQKQEKERVLNGHSLSMMRMFKMCEISNDSDRVKQAMHNKLGQVPVARGVDKTHKDGIDANVGPKLRMIVAANEAPNSQISENLCDILKPLAEILDKKKKTKLTSTEELLAEFDEYNKNVIPPPGPPSAPPPPPGPPPLHQPPPPGPPVSDQPPPGPPVPDQPPPEPPVPDQPPPLPQRVNQRRQSAATIGAAVCDALFADIRASPPPLLTNPVKKLIVSLKLKGLILTSLKNHELQQQDDKVTN